MTIEFKNMSDACNHAEIHRQLIEKYAGKKPRIFLQLDHYSKEGQFTCPTTWELMVGSPVRILINGDIRDPLKISEMLKDIADEFARPEYQERWTTQLAALGDPENSRFEMERQRAAEFDDDIPF